MNIYLVCPVRGVSEEEASFLDRQVALMEDLGHKVHYPPRDVDQSDPVGTEIVYSHKNAMKESDLVKIFYNPSSNGSCFDLGMAIMAQKPLQVIGNLAAQPLDGIAMLIAEYSGRRPRVSNLFNDIVKRKREIEESNFIQYKSWDSKNPFLLLDLGMIIMAGTPLLLKEGHNIQPTEGKSFDNVVLRLNEKFGCGH